MRTTYFVIETTNMKHPDQSRIVKLWRKKTNSSISIVTNNEVTLISICFHLDEVYLDEAYISK